jgi:hypothetical protein
VVAAVRTKHKFSVGDAKNHPKSSYRLAAPHITRAKRAKKTKQKNIGRFFAEEAVFLRESCVFACLAPQHFAACVKKGNANKDHFHGRI